MNVTDFTAHQLDCLNLVGVLTPKSQKGKQRIKQWGDTGKILRVVDSVQFSPIGGRWFAINAGDKTWRWVHHTQDADFDITITPWGDGKAKTHATTGD